MTYRAKFRVGDVVEVVSIDSQVRFGGSFVEGDLLSLIRYDAEDDTWRYRFADGRHPHEAWISQSDLGPMKPNEELDAEARQLFGIDPPTHCPTCKRAFDDT